MKRGILIGSLICFGIIIGVAHEFWMMPKKFRYEVGEEMQVAFLAGENFQGEPWDLSRHKVERLEVHSGITVKKLAEQAKPDKGKNLTYKFDREGTHLVALESNFAFIEQTPEEFAKYLEEDG